MHLHIDESMEAVVCLRDGRVFNVRGPPVINGVPVLRELGHWPREVELILKLLIDHTFLSKGYLSGVILTLSVDKSVKVFVGLRLLNPMVLILSSVEV